jgi:metal-responsive CopG/Arc/MetJ family transcriptional regulator
MRRTTVALPADLLEAADRAVRSGSAKSRADLLARALRRELTAQRRAAVDAAFEAMADDPEYQAEALRIGEEFRYADWEALRLGDRKK